jgi:hypothetical protein
LLLFFILKSVASSRRGGFPRDDGSEGAAEHRDNMVVSVLASSILPASSAQPRDLIFGFDFACVYLLFPALRPVGSCRLLLFLISIKSVAC